MGRRSSEEAENHWPGFVDALSTIVMVVTFLLIILAIAIFAMSQNIAKSYVESQAKIAERGGGDMYNEDKKDASKDFHSSEKSQSPESENSPAKIESANAAQAQEVETKTQTTQEKISETTKEKSASSKVKAQLAQELTADEEIEADQKLAVLSRKTDIEEERIVVAAAEKNEAPKKIRVVKAASILTLQFDKSGVKIDENSSTRVRDFVASKESLTKDTKLTIWSFTGTKTSSVSEAKRIAYYRALAARNELINNGLAQDNIAVEIRFGNTENLQDTVQIVVTR